MTLLVSTLQAVFDFCRVLAYRYVAADRTIVDMSTFKKAFFKNEAASAQTTRLDNIREKEVNHIPFPQLENSVQEKWMGTESDKREMRMLGRAQVLRVGAFDA